MIKVRHGVGGTKYQVILHRLDGKPLTRTFRRLTDAKAWAQREEQRLRERPANVPNG